MKLRYFVHDAEILRLTKQHNVDHDEIYSLGGIAGGLADAQHRALVDCGRDAVVEYWRVFLYDFLSGEIDVDADGMFATQLSLEEMEYL